MSDAPHDDEDDKVTPVRGSGGYPILRQMARDQAKRLPIVGPNAWIRRRLLEIAEEMEGWLPDGGGPAEVEREALRSELVRLCQEVVELLKPE